MSAGPVDFNHLNPAQRKMLRQALMGVFGGSEALGQFLRKTGFEPQGGAAGAGDFDQEVSGLISALSRSGQLDRFVSEAVRAYPGTPGLRGLNERLTCADQDLDLERRVRNSGFADLNLWAGQLLAAGRRVCRISYPVSGGSVQGTGFLVGPDRVLTNYHVVEPLLQGKAQPASVRLGFGFAETPSGPLQGDAYSLATEWIEAQSPYSAADLSLANGSPAPTELDFALLRLDRAAGEARVPDGKRGWFDLNQAVDPPSGDAIVFVLQHPEGRPLKQSIGVVKPSPSAVRFRYDADTEPGSSGGLVLDEHLQPVALHHAGDPGSKVKAEFNQGIPLTAIRALLPPSPPVPPAVERTTTTGKARIFISYSRRDARLKDELITHLAPLKHQGLVEVWHDGDVTPGAKWEPEIFAHLREADVILLLVSASFIASPFCYDREVTMALERHEAGAACVIPVIVRECDWEALPFGKLAACRRGAPAASATNRDRAWTEVVQEIGAVIASLRLGSR